MTFLAPHALWLLALAPVVWWLVRHRLSRAEVRVPHLPVLEAVLNARDLTPVAPPWRALLLVAALVLAVLAGADPRRWEPQPHRVVVLATGGGESAEAALALAGGALAGDDVQVAAVRPGGLEAADGTARATDHRNAPRDAALRAAEAAAGAGGFVVPIGVAAPETAPYSPRPVEPEARPAIVVADGEVIPRWLAAALAALPGLVSSAGAVEPDDLKFALRQRPGAFVVGIGVGPGAAPEADWICLLPPAGDRTLPRRLARAAGTAVGTRFDGSHPISRGLSAAGIELDGHHPVQADPRYVTLLQSDRGVAAIAGAPTPDSRCVAVLGDPGRAFALFPAWPRFMRRSIAWLARERQARRHPHQRAGSVERPAGDAAALDHPRWRGRTRGVVRLAPGRHPLGQGRTLHLEPDPFAPPAAAAVAPPALPPRGRRPAPSGPGRWLALLAAAALALGTFRF